MAFYYFYSNAKIGKYQVRLLRLSIFSLSEMNSSHYLKLT